MKSMRVDDQNTAARCRSTVVHRERTFFHVHRYVHAMPIEIKAAVSDNLENSRRPDELRMRLKNPTLEKSWGVGPVMPAEKIRRAQPALPKYRNLTSPILP